MYLPKLHQVKMEKRWLFSLFCLLLAPSVAGQPGEVITEAEEVHALPGANVTLVCSFSKPHSTYVIQTQWSKTDDTQLTRIAVYHPVYGIHYFTFPEASYSFSASFNTRKCCNWDTTEALCSPDPNVTSECNWWALHLENLTVSLSGQYECSFATYPYGSKAAKIQLIVKAEEEQHYVKEVWLNQTLEIPCIQDTTSENLSNYPLKWLVGESGRKEELVTKEPSCPAAYRNGSALYGQRVRLGLNNTLMIFPTKITDDGRVFSCHVTYHPERVQKSSTTVRVFAYPEISVSLQESSAGTSQKPNVSCVVRKAFPKPSLLWYVDRASLSEQPGEVSVEQEDWQDSEGFYQLRSTLILQRTHQAYKMFSCACLFSILGGETRNISSEEIFVTFALLTESLHVSNEALWKIKPRESDNKSNEASSKAFTTMTSEDRGNSALPSAVMTTSDHQLTSLASLDFTSQASLASTSTTQAGALISTTETKSYTSATALNESLTTTHLNDSTTESPQSLRNATRSSEKTTLVRRNLSFSITDQPISVTRGKDFFTTSNLLNSTAAKFGQSHSHAPGATHSSCSVVGLAPGRGAGCRCGYDPGWVMYRYDQPCKGGVRNTKASHFPWPTVVAVLLLFCSFLIALGIRKWCQYQKEIMNRPPSFKPPPPPIKYAYIVESDGTSPSCHELENL